MGMFNTKKLKGEPMAMPANTLSRLHLHCACTACAARSAFSSAAFAKFIWPFIHHFLPH